MGSGTHQVKWRYVKDSYDSSGDDCGWIKDVNFTPPPPPEPDYVAEALDSGLTFVTDGNDLGWIGDNGTWCKRDGDCVKLTAPTEGAHWIRATVTGAGTIP